QLPLPGKRGHRIPPGAVDLGRLEVDDLAADVLGADPAPDPVAGLHHDDPRPLGTSSRAAATPAIPAHHNGFGIHPRYHNRNLTIFTPDAPRIAKGLKVTRSNQPLSAFGALAVEGYQRILYRQRRN